MGVSAPSLHRESTDSLIYDVHTLYMMCILYISRVYYIYLLHTIYVMCILYISRAYYIYYVHTIINQVHVGYCGV